MGLLTTHEAYLEHKDHPMVLMLLEFFRNGDSFKIPEVWKSFIMKSTDQTDINLLLSQLHVWGLAGTEIDTSLRGPALFDNLFEARLRAVFVKADSIHATTKPPMPWPLALERAFEDRRLIPPMKQRQAVSKGHVSVNCNLNYTERGVVNYSFRRSISNILLLVPPEWVLAHCGPERSDREIMDLFKRDLCHGFAPDEVRREGGLLHRGWLRKVLQQTDVERWNPLRMCSSLRNVFPKTFQAAGRDSEPIISVQVSEATASTIDSDEEANRRNVELTPALDRRSNPYTTSMEYPVFMQRDLDVFSHEGIPAPPRERIYYGVLGTEPARQADNFEAEVAALAEGLRRVYTDLSRAEEYDRLRAEAMSQTP
jgi:hypothetical protein